MDKGFKTATMDKLESLHEKMGNFNREMET